MRNIRHFHLFIFWSRAVMLNFQRRRRWTMGLLSPGTARIQVLPTLYISHIYSVVRFRK